MRAEAAPSTGFASVPGEAAAALMPWAAEVALRVQVFGVCVGQETPGVRHLFTARHFVLCVPVGVSQGYRCVHVCLRWCAVCLCVRAAQGGDVM